MPEISVLVDLNIVIDVLQHRQPFYEDSAAILDAVSQGKINGYLAAHSITTLVYVITRLQNQAVAMAAIRKLLTVFTVAELNDDTIRIALDWNWPDFEDAVQMATAVHTQADYLITRNRKDFPSQFIPVLEPLELLTILTET